VARFVEETDYPFDDTIRLRFFASRRVRFPLALRIPAWCENPVITVNGRPEPSPTPGRFARVEREWAPGDTVVLRFPMRVRIAPGVNDSVSVWRGPLLYTLQIEETWRAYAKGKREGFDSYEVTPASAWNYGLVLGAGPEAAFRVQRRRMPPNPFDPAQPPVRLLAPAKKIPAWTLAWNKHVSFDPPVSPVASDAPTETVTLVPFGAQMLRVSNFPVIGAARPFSTEFRDDFAAGHFDHWVTYGGGWRVRAKAFGPSSDATSSKAVATKTRFRDFTYEADVSVAAVGNAGLIFRVSDPSIGADDYNGYYVGLSAETGQVLFGKADGKWTPLRTAAMPLTANRPHHVRIEARGADLRVFVGDMGQPIIEATDDSFGEGAIGVRQYGARPEGPQAAFGNIAVRGLED